MKKHLALALLIAGSVLNTSLVMADEPTSDSKFSKVTHYLADQIVDKKDLVVEKAKAHPYVASTTAAIATLFAAYKFSATFRRLIGMETQEDIQKRYSAFEI